MQTRGGCDGPINGMVGNFCKFSTLFSSTCMMSLLKPESEHCLNCASGGGHLKCIGQECFLQMDSVVKEQIGHVAPILVLLLTGYEEGIVTTCCWNLLVVVSGTCSHSCSCGHSSRGLSHYYSAKYV